MWYAESYNLPKSLQVLKIRVISVSTFDFECLPPFLQQLHLINGDRGSFSNVHGHYISLLPHSLERLFMYDAEFDGDFIDPPPALTHLSVPIYFKSTVDILPKSLTHLYLTEHFNQPLDNLPPQLQCLIITSIQYNGQLDCLPATLTTLIISHHCK